MSEEWKMERHSDGLEGNDAGFRIMVKNGISWWKSPSVPLKRSARDSSLTFVVFKYHQDHHCEIHPSLLLSHSFLAPLTLLRLARKQANRKAVNPSRAWLWTVRLLGIPDILWCGESRDGRSEREENKYRERKRVRERRGKFERWYFKGWQIYGERGWWRYSLGKRDDALMFY